MEHLKLIQSQNKLGEFLYVVQDEPKGLGHAVWCARDLINKRARDKRALAKQEK